jgi:hypothetical protein
MSVSEHRFFVTAFANSGSDESSANDLCEESEKGENNTTVYAKKTERVKNNTHSLCEENGD